MHLADLHIGKQFKNISLLEDQRYILEQIVQIAKQEKIDAVLIAGDVYQRSTPQAEAMTLFNDFVTELCNERIRVFIISGNHDSDQRIAYLSSLVRGAGLYVSECFSGSIQKIELNDRYGKINIHMLPFIKPATVRRYYPGEKIISYQDAVNCALAYSPINTKERNILLCHQFITGAQPCESEEKTIGGLDNIDASLFDAYDYVALGHIHGPQKLLRDTLRYAGSPLKYSLSEAHHRKSVCIVDAEEKGSVQVRTHLLEPLHDVRKVEGTYDEIMNRDMPPSDDYVGIVLHDEEPPMDARNNIRNTMFHNMIGFSIENSKMSETLEIGTPEGVEDKSPMELFMDFYADQNNKVAPSQAQMDIFEEALKAAKEGDQA